MEDAVELLWPFGLGGVSGALDRGDSAAGDSYVGGNRSARQSARGYFLPAATRLLEDAGLGAERRRVPDSMTQELREATLKFGRELIVTTTGAKQSKLILTPAA